MFLGPLVFQSGKIMDYFNKNLKFNSKTYGKLLFSEVIDRISIYMKEVPNAMYSFIIGTDSTASNNGGRIEYVTAVLVHRIGFGGIYFWHSIPDIGNSMYERVFKESALSLEFSEVFLHELKKRDMHNFSFEIHVDVGNNGKTREIITQVVGMIKGNGYKVVTKPYSYVASKVADRHT